jgi:hypothetical protein
VSEHQAEIGVLRSRAESWLAPKRSILSSTACSCEITLLPSRPPASVPRGRAARRVQNPLVMRCLCGLVVGALIAVVGIAPAGAERASSPAPCWKQVVGEWYTGAITTIFPLRCYAEAIERFPEAKHDLRAAEAAAVFGRPAPPEEKEPPARIAVSPARRQLGPTLLPCFVTQPGRRCSQSAAPTLAPTSGRSGEAVPPWLWPVVAGSLLVTGISVAFRRRLNRT